MTQQPKWKFVDNMGDVNPIDHGGRFLFVDETGVYDPEIAVLVPPKDTEEVETDQTDEDGDPIMLEVGKWELYRYLLEKCTYVNGVLSDNEFHPDHPVWFASDLDSICSTCDRQKQDLIDGLCGTDPVKRAFAYEAIESYWDFDNLGAGQALEFEDRNEVEQWCKDHGISV